MDPVSDATTAADGTRGCTDNTGDDPTAAEVRNFSAAVVTDAASVQVEQPELPTMAESPANKLFSPAPAEPGEQPLENDRHELFCQHVTGWGGTGEPVKGFEAYKSVYGITNEPTARVNASRLLSRPDVQARCAWMRSRLAASVLMDKAAIRADLLSKRYKIVEKTVNTRDKDIALAAMRDIEKSMGLDGPSVETTTEETSVTAAAIAAISQNIENVAAQFAARKTIVKTTVTKE